jgi:phosphoglycerate kinase
MPKRPFRTLDELTFAPGTRVLVRAALDVPIENGVVTNQFRITKTLPTLQHLVSLGARVILLTHVGRDPSNTTAPIFDVLRSLLPCEHTEAVVGEAVENLIAAQAPGTVVLLGNARSLPGEEANDPEYARALTRLAEVYVNDAFAVSHRAHASIVGVPALLPAYAGRTFTEEYDHLARALVPDHPALFILGGAKFETKQPLIERYVTEYDHVVLGGALANDFLKARGFPVGASLVSPVDLSQNPLIHTDTILLPTDVVVDDGRTVPVTAVGAHEKILDIGTQSVEALAPYINDAKTILWNGPLGYYEGGFDGATKAVARMIADSSAFSVVGGGDTVAAIESLGLSHQFGFLSTAGGAMLEYLEKGTLPGIEALRVAAS